MAGTAQRDGWLWIAKACREQRALESSRLRTLVGGQVHFTRLLRGKVSTEVLHTYNDTGAEFLKLIAWTHHPQAQLAACWCDSGETWRECHMLEHIDDPCGCGSGASLRDCHAVEVAASTALTGGALNAP